jgi:hypothetical protein
VSGIICGFAGSRARVRLFYTHCNFTREHNVKPAPVLVGTNTNPYPHPTGFLPAGKRVICARCHPYSPELAPPRQPPPAAVDPPRRQPPHPNSDHPSTLGEPTGHAPPLARSGARPARRNSAGAAASHGRGNQLHFPDFLQGSR